MDPDELKDQISRRSMLKRIGAGAAVAWTAPVLSSLRMPAYAQATPRCAPEPPCGTACGSVFPDDFVLCAATCICVETVEGRCACIQLNVSTGPCTSTAECGSAAVCVKATCLGDVCQPLCTSDAATAAASGPNIR